MSDHFLPPPPYEVSQQEFDRKTSSAVQISQQAYDEAWEEWDENLFEANQNTSNSRPSVGGSSLRVAKKERPSWLADTYVGESSSQPSSAGQSQSSARHNIPPEDDEDNSLPPPPFTPCGPSLDGPPFEEVVLAYHAPRSVTPPSPLMSPRTSQYSLPSVPPTQYPRPLPPPRRTVRRTAPRPATSFTPPTKGTQRAMGPRMEFNPLTAYSKYAHEEWAREEITSAAPGAFNAASFYNSAVSAHLSPLSSSNNMQSSRPSSMGHNRSQSHYSPLNHGDFSPAGPPRASYVHETPEQRYSHPDPRMNGDPRARSTRNMYHT